MENLKVCVIGAGIMGVSSAYQIQSNFSGASVDILSDSFSPNNTSDVAAGYWRPPDVPKHLQDKYLRWALKTQEHILQTLKIDSEAHLKGYSICHGYRLSEIENLELPYWKDIGLNLKMLSRKELELFPRSVQSGYAYTTVVIESSLFSNYYLDSFQKNGGTVIKRHLDHISELYDDYDIIINCSGAGARYLVNDEKVFPIRGYVLRVEAPWIKEFIYTLDLNSKGQSKYIYPNKDCVILGGYKQKSSYSTEINKEETEAIIKETSKIYPSLLNATVLSKHVGFRPGRCEVRLELEKLSNVNKRAQAVIHNYGHGGSGITLSWGCSLTVLDLFKEFLSNKGLGKSNTKSKL